MPELTFPVEEIDDGTGVIQSGNLAACTCGPGSDTFYVFWLAGSNHPHMQCAQCEQCYCPFNLCQPYPQMAPDPEVE